MERHNFVPTDYLDQCIKHREAHGLSTHVSKLDCDDECPANDTCPNNPDNQGDLHGSEDPEIKN